MIMEKNIKIENCGITFNAYDEGFFNAALMEINGEQKFFSADTPKELLNKISSFLLNLCELS